MSHWPVSSAATTELITEMFARFARNPAAGRAEALRGAMMAMMSDSRNPLGALPMFWAPFVVVGEGGVTSPSQ